MAVKTSDASKVINDYRKFVEAIKDRAEGKVQQAVSQITNRTNSQYSSDNLDQRVQLTIDPIYYQMSQTGGIISGVASAKPIREFIYLEFGTRQRAGDTLSIKGGWQSGINASLVAAPYKSSNPNFFWKEGPIIGRYYFLNNIDQEGMRFLKNFFK